MPELMVVAPDWELEQARMSVQFPVLVIEPELVMPPFNVVVLCTSKVRPPLPIAKFPVPLNVKLPVPPETSPRVIVMLLPLMLV